MSNDKLRLSDRERLDKIDADLGDIEKLLNTIAEHQRVDRIEQLLNTHDEREKQLLDSNIEPKDINYVKLS